MAVTKSLGDESKRDKFIAKGNDSGEYTNILLRVPTAMLFKIEKKKESWKSRTVWILEALTEKLNKEEA